jgi:hypothetical protein
MTNKEELKRVLGELKGYYPGVEERLKQVDDMDENQAYQVLLMLSILFKSIKKVLAGEVSSGS